MHVPDATAGRTPVEARVFHSLAGDWRLSRTIPGHGSMTGVARFRHVEPAVLSYEEEGRLALTSGLVVTARREYRYVLERGQIRVTFARPSEPGGTLHVLRLRRDPPTQRCDVMGAAGWPVVANDVHLCGLDTYAGEYRFEHDSRIVIRMRVQGPAKGFWITTVLDRR
ncbi:MAG TPA: DUF6314 family protein [Candidatus Dormibacteraeota bacterium]